MILLLDNVLHFMSLFSSTTYDRSFIVIELYNCISTFKIVWRLPISAAVSQFIGLIKPSLSCGRYLNEFWNFLLNFLFPIYIGLIPKNLMFVQNSPRSSIADQNHSNRAYLSILRNFCPCSPSSPPLPPSHSSTRVLS